MIKSIKAFLRIGGAQFILLAVALILNHRMGYITLIGLFSILVGVNITLRSKMDKGAMTILVYSILYVFFSYLNGFSYAISAIVLFAVAPFFFYQFGNNIAALYRKEDYIIVLWLIIVLCYCLDIFYVTLSGIVETGQFINPQRELFFSESGTQNKVNATVVGLSMNIGMIGLPMSIILKNNYMRVCSLLIFILSLITTFSLLNRTGIVVALLCFTTVIAYKSRKNFKLLFLSLASIVFVIWLLFYFGIINAELIELYRERNVDIYTMGARTDRWRVALGYLFTHPFGWADYGEKYYIHNMWLDVARISGIIPFLLLVYMAVDSFKKAFQLIKKYESPLSYMLLGLNVCFFATCFVEPIYGGTPMLLYCMLWGTSTGILKMKNIE